MDMTNQEYGRYVSQKAKPSPLWKNLLWAFVTGGLICTGPAESVPWVRAERERRRHRRVGDHHLPGGPFYRAWAVR